ncbi:MAG TPA: YkvA family protein [Cyclobacteriaceae bacterium]|nr:YkvA family protein [Cyclobacteriaceae bacterium]
MKNPFFDVALTKASRLAGKPGRIALLLAKLGERLTRVDWKSVSMAATKEKLLVFSRIASAYASGRYRDISWKSVLIVLAAIIYFLNPIDLVPDFIPVLGLTDDFSVLLWVYKTVGSEIDKFLAWERSLPKAA